MDTKLLHYKAKKLSGTQFTDYDEERSSGTNQYKIKKKDMNC